VTVTGDQVLAELVALPVDARDAAVERLLGIVSDESLRASPGPELLGYHASGLSPVFYALMEAPVTERDVFVDLGSGLGKVAALARLISGARALGIEVQQNLVERSPKLDGVRYVHADVRDAPLDEGTVFFLYNPCTGGARKVLMERLHEVAQRHAIVVCALGMDVEHGTESWLVPRATDHFWLQLFDSVVPGVAPRCVARPDWDERVLQLARER
jgi:SAM-dependent methyltransferase